MIHVISIIFSCFSFISCENGLREYKISMVSSESKPGRPAQFSHAESPVWDPERNCLFFVDVHQQNIHRLDYDSGKIYTKHIGYGQVNVVSLVGGSTRLLVAVRAELFLLDWTLPGDQALRLLSSVDIGRPENVINEGKPDAVGRFWAGTKGMQTGAYVVPDQATFYRFDETSMHAPRVALRPVSISNGLAWARNNTVFYYTDSLTQKVEAFDFDISRGELSGRRTIIDITEHGYDDGIPDGMTIDSQGNLWVAIMFKGVVLHVDPDARRILYTYKLPVTHVTSVSWGGPQLDELFITTSRGGTHHTVDIAAQPLAGALFTLRDTGFFGVQPNVFRFENADAY